MKALRLPTHVFPVTYLFRFRALRGSLLASCSLLPALPSGWRLRFGLGSLFSRRSIAGSLSRGREWDISDCMSLSTNEATHPRCNVEGCPDRPGRASYM